VALPVCSSLPFFCSFSLISIEAQYQLAAPWLMPAPADASSTLWLPGDVLLLVFRCLLPSELLEVACVNRK
jgi:hypothetical protein